MFDIDPRIEHAQTPPSSLYGDADVYRHVLARVFAPSRQADVLPPPGPGRARGWTWLEGSHDEPLLWTRDGDGRLRCVSNVCTHRGALICDGEGASERLRCPYHGRTFGADGRLIAAPGFEGAADFPAARDDLREWAHGTWGPLGFASVGGTDSPSAALSALEERLVRFDPSVWMEHAPSRRTHIIDASWALYCDNYLEGFHVPFVHPALARAIDLDAYRVDLLPDGVLQTAYARDGEAALQTRSSEPDSGRAVAAWYVSLFPNTMLNVYPWGLSLNRVRPLGPRRTAIDYAAFVRDESLRNVGAGAALDRVEAEDQEVVLSAQRGVRSQAYERGRYSPRHERGVHHFHRWLATRLAD